MQVLGNLLKEKCVSEANQQLFFKHVVESSFILKTKVPQNLTIHFGGNFIMNGLSSSTVSCLTEILATISKTGEWNVNIMPA